MAECKVAVRWDHSVFQKDTETAALDGIEECLRGPVLSQAKQDCPVLTGTLRNSINVERNDPKREIYIGAGGAAKDYAFRQEMDRSLNHPRGGKAGFLRDSVQIYAPEIPKYIEKHIKK